MLKAALLSLALIFAYSAVPVAAASMAAPASAAVTAEDVSSAKRKKASVKKSRRKAASRSNRRASAPAAGQSARERGNDVCRGDAIRLCKPYLGQGDFAVLGCFKQRAARLSSGCRALLVGYGQL